MTLLGLHHNSGLALWLHLKKEISTLVECMLVGTQNEIRPELHFELDIEGIDDGELDVGLLLEL